jgi:hypothetical protein
MEPAMTFFSAIGASPPRPDLELFGKPSFDVSPHVLPVPDADERAASTLDAFGVFGARESLKALLKRAVNENAAGAPTASLADFDWSDVGATRTSFLAGFGDGYVYGPQLDGATDDSRMPPVDQGDTNSCGTSSLAMIMNYLGVPVSRQDIDSEVRRVDQGAMPQPLIDYARANGLEAEGYNHGSWDEIKGYIERGIPVQALINVKADGDPSNGHFVAVVGFRTDPKTGEEQIGFRNSADGGKVNWMSRAEFENKWTNHFAGFDKFFIAYAPGGTDLPKGRWDGIEALNAMGNGAWNVMNNFDRIFSPDNFGNFVHGLIGLPGGIVQTIGGAIGFGVQTFGQWLDKKVGDVPVLGWFARPVGQIIGGIGAGIGNFFGGIGDAFNNVGGAFDKLFNGDVGGFFGGLWNAGTSFIGGVVGAVGSVAGGFVDAAGSVVSTVGDGVEAVGNAISDGVSAVGDFIGDLF